MTWKNMVLSNRARIAPEILTNSDNVDFIAADPDVYNTEVLPCIVKVDTTAVRMMGDLRASSYLCLTVAGNGVELLNVIDL